MRVWDGRVRAPAPTKFGGTFRFCRRGQRPRRPAGGHMGPPLRRKTGREHWLGKLRRGSGTAPRANFAHPGPSGPAGIEILTQILRAGRALMRDRRAPRKGGPGEPGGKPSLANKVRLCGVPRRRFGYFAAVGKVTRRPQTAEFPAKRRAEVVAPYARKKAVPSSPPHPSGLRPATFPPGGRLLRGKAYRRLIAAPTQKNGGEIPRLHKILRGS